MFEGIGVNVSITCRRMALKIEFLTPGTHTSHASLGSLTGN